MCRTSTITPTESWPGAHSGLSRRPAASSSSAMHFVVASTAGKSSPVIGFSAAAVSASVTVYRNLKVAPVHHRSSRSIFSSRIRRVTSSRGFGR